MNVERQKLKSGLKGGQRTERRAEDQYKIKAIRLVKNGGQKAGKNGGH